MKPEDIGLDKKYPDTLAKPVTKGNITYNMLPLNIYQLKNLMGLLKRSRRYDNGDWYEEICMLIDIIISKMESWNYLYMDGNNFNDMWTGEDLRTGKWRK